MLVEQLEAAVKLSPIGRGTAGRRGGATRHLARTGIDVFAVALDVRKHDVSERRANSCRHPAVALAGASADQSRAD